MSEQDNILDAEIPGRRMLQDAGATVLGGLAASAALPLPLPAQTSSSANAAARNTGPLGARLQGVQHFGLTVQNMDRAYAFYTGVMGGTEVMRHGDFYGDPIHNTLLADQEVEASERRVNPLTPGAPDLRGGAQRWMCDSSSSTTS